ncbi:hypothetical protein EUGRSUZ_F02556 [Eucalyptus grandis]|uniref:Uncharacterized protein n=2 Tax=Eucalyptus grandis TaxID=71139 RepID=A0ACC3KIS3_EUCGR|nr:hypothetical protein EUGRSUZ_F02556 [Eucalyptus grandis]
MLSHGVGSRRSSTGLVRNSSSTRNIAVPSRASKNQRPVTISFPSNHYRGSSTCQYNTRLNACSCAPGKRSARTAAAIVT